MIGTVLVLSVFVGGQWLPMEQPKPMPSVEACMSAGLQFLKDHEEEAMKPDTPTISAECLVGVALEGNPA